MSTFVQNTTFFLLLFSKSVYGGFSLVYCSPCLLVFRFLIVVFLYFSRCFLVSFSVRPGQVFRKPCLIDLRRIYVVGLKSAAWRYCNRSGLVLWSRILFYVASDYFVSWGTPQISVFLFLVPLSFSCPFFWTYISCSSSVVVHPSSHKTPNDISGYVFIFGSIWICLTFLIGPVAGLLIFLITSLWSHLVVLLSFYLKLWQGPLLWWLFLIGVYLHLSLQFLACLSRRIWWVPNIMY